MQNDGHSRTRTGARGWRDCQGTPRIRPKSNAVIFRGRGCWAFSSARRVRLLLSLRQNLHYLRDKFRMFPQRFQKFFISHAIICFLRGLGSCQVVKVDLAISFHVICKIVKLAMNGIDTRIESFRFVIARFP